MGSNRKKDKVKVCGQSVALDQDARLTTYEEERMQIIARNNERMQQSVATLHADRRKTDGMFVEKNNNPSGSDTSLRKLDEIPGPIHGFVASNMASESGKLVDDRGESLGG